MRDGFHFANHCIRLLPVRFFTLLFEPNVLRTSVVFGESFVCDNGSLWADIESVRYRLKLFICWLMLEAYYCHLVLIEMV